MREAHSRCSSIPHTARIIHRDIKPENMMVGRHGEVMFSDFSIAAILQSTYTSTQILAVEARASYILAETDTL